MAQTLKSVQDFEAGRYDAWIFDLDNTIYPASSGLFGRVSARMTLFIQEMFDLNHEGAFRIQKDLFRRYGTTASGLMKEHKVDPGEFMAFVHDIDLDDVEPDPELEAMLAGLPGTKVIFTNGTERHAQRILDAYGIGHHFNGCYDIVQSGHRPKPEPAVYGEMMERHGIEPRHAVMIEDMAVNLKPASAMGVTTVWLRDDIGEPGGDADHIDFIELDLKTFLRKVVSRFETLRQGEGQ